MRQGDLPHFFVCYFTLGRGCEVEGAMQIHSSTAPAEFCRIQGPFV